MMQPGGPRSAGFRRSLLVPLFALLPVAHGCSDLAAGSPLENARTSKEAVVREVFRALQAHDTAAIRSLMVTREEYETLLWPELPDRHQVPLDFVWSVREPRRQKALRELLGKLGGSELRLESFTWADEPEVYAGFTIHKGADVMARQVETGVVGKVDAFDVLVDYDGGWKLLDLDEF